jgi:AcrR family transcriptional regulator
MAADEDNLLLWPSAAPPGREPRRCPSQRPSPLCDTRCMTARPRPTPSPLRGVRRDATLNRERILTVAAELMGRRGRNVPVAEIAEAAGVGVGTFYRGFPDRTALLHALEHRAYDLLIAALDRIREAGQTGADAVQSYLEECLDLGDQLVLPLRGAPPLTDAAAIDARRRINNALEQFLADGRDEGTVRADVNATDIIACGAIVTQPLPLGPNWSTIARRHIHVFVRGISASAVQRLPGPAVTQRDIETTFAAGAAD